MKEAFRYLNSLAKRFNFRPKVALLALRAANRVIFVFLTTSLLTGCATTSSQSAQYKPHKPQMITGDEDREATLKLPDSIAAILSFLGNFANPGDPGTSWR